MASLARVKDDLARSRHAGECSIRSARRARAPE
jgi:hypothetical protein